MMISFSLTHNFDSEEISHRHVATKTGATNASIQAYVCFFLATFRLLLLLEPVST